MVPIAGCIKFVVKKEPALHLWFCFVYAIRYRTFDILLKFNKIEIVMMWSLAAIIAWTFHLGHKAGRKEEGEWWSPERRNKKVRTFLFKKTVLPLIVVVQDCASLIRNERELQHLQLYHILTHLLIMQI